MAELIQNPRRAPRAPVRCSATVVSAAGNYQVTTEDVGGHGCQLVCPRPVRKGEPVQVLVAHEGVRPLKVSGRVAWASDRAPWRLGIAYDEAFHPQSSAWFEALLAAVPGLPTFRRIPDRIPVDAIVYLASPPRFLVDFTPQEVALLRAIGGGTSVAELRAQLPAGWPQLLHALFSLLAHQHATLTRGSSVHPDAWKKILTGLEASPAVEVPRGDASWPPVAAARSDGRGEAATSPGPPLGAAAATPAPPASPAWPPAGVAVAPPWEQGPLSAGPTAAPAEAAAARSENRGVAATLPGAPWGAPSAAVPLEDSPATWLVPAADFVPAAWPREAVPPPPGQGTRGQAQGRDGGMAWTATPPPLTGGYALAPARRSAEAQGCYERALAELGAGRSAGAMALLRRALALAPGDPEIAGALEKVGARRG